MINLQLTIEELRALIIALELESFRSGFAFKHKELLIRLHDLEYLNEKN